MHVTNQGFSPAWSDSNRTESNEMIIRCLTKAGCLFLTRNYLAATALRATPPPSAKSRRKPSTHRSSADYQPPPKEKGRLGFGLLPFTSGGLPVYKCHHRAKCQGDEGVGKLLNRVFAVGPKNAWTLSSKTVRAIEQSEVQRDREKKNAGIAQGKI